MEGEEEDEEVAPAQRGRAHRRRHETEVTAACGRREEHEGRRDERETGEFFSTMRSVEFVSPVDRSGFRRLPL
jgi:hypothetical protein